MALFLEFIVANVVRPAVETASRSSMTFQSLLSLRSEPYPLEKGGLQLGSRPPLLYGKTAEVAGGRPVPVPAEVNDPELGPVHEPVAWLPVTVGRHDHHRFWLMGAEHGPGFFCGRFFRAVGCVSQATAFAVAAAS